MLSYARSLRGQWREAARTVLAWAVPFLVTLYVIPDWVLSRMAARGDTPWLAALPILLSPALVVIIAAAWRMKPDSDPRMWAFTGAISGFGCTVVFAVYMFITRG